MLISASAGSSRQNKHVVIFLFNEICSLAITVSVLICHYEFYVHLRQCLTWVGKFSMCYLLIHFILIFKPVILKYIMIVHYVLFISISICPS